MRSGSLILSRLASKIAFHRLAFPSSRFAILDKLSPALTVTVRTVDPALEIQSVRLNFKEGGKKGFWRHPKAEAVKTRQAPKLGAAAVITVSDRAYKKIYPDKSHCSMRVAKLRC